jgi:multidrug efflux pump subunit AcrA (membrane-fusion protein)
MSLQPSLPAAPAEQVSPPSANGPVAEASPNGSPFPQAARLPKARQASRASRWLILGGALALVLAGVAVWFFWFRGPSVRADLIVYEVKRVGQLQLKVNVERGTLEAKDNHFIICEVKPGSRGAPKIKEVLENGTQVKGPVYAPWQLFGKFQVPTRLGDVIVVIDDSSLQEQSTNQKNLRDRAEADMIAAELLYPSKVTAIALAKQNKDKWVKGDFPQQQHDLEGQIETSQSNLLQEEDRMAWVSRMVKKTYMTASQEEAERAQLKGNELDVRKKKELLDVLIKYTNETNLQDLDNKSLIAVNEEKAAKADMIIKQAVFKQQDALYQDLQEQIAQCTIRAPHSGIVVYYTPEQTMRGSGSNQSIIAQGEPVQYGQKMMSIPDLSRMQVNVRIHEASVGHMNVKARVEDVVEDGSADTAGLKKGDVIVKLNDTPISCYYPDLVEALGDYKTGDQVKLKVLRDAKELDVALTFGDHKHTGPRKTGSGSGQEPYRLFGARFQAGLPAIVRVDAAPDEPLRAHVANVALVAAPQDWMSADVKVYQAYVEIDEPAEKLRRLKLKPGSSAVCTIFTETKAENVLTVPVQTIIPSTQMGGEPSVMVMTANGPEKRTVKLLKVEGKVLSDDKFVAIESGLSEGDKVVENPKTAMGDKDKKSGKDGDKPGPDARPDRPADGGRGKGRPGGPTNGPPGPR